MSDTFVGVDVAKAEFVVACRPAVHGEPHDETKCRWTQTEARLELMGRTGCRTRRRPDSNHKTSAGMMPYP
jgi:hypothetical protein